MWRIVGNLIAAALYAVLATAAFAPIVLWIRSGHGLTEQSLQGLVAVAIIVFVAVLFTPKGKGAFRRGARITAYALLTMPIPLAFILWHDLMEGIRENAVRTIWFYALPILALMLVPIVLGLILMLISRQKPPA